MFRIIIIAAMTVSVTACDDEAWRTPEGCKIFMTPEMRQHTDACVAAYHAEKARLEGRNVTTCRTVGSTTTCVEG